MLFAVDENGSITDIKEAISGASYFCPACHEQLIAKTKGTKRRPHFAHKASSDCIHGYETALHLMAKKIVEEADSFYLPQISFIRNDMRVELVVKGQTVKFAHVESEKWLDDIVPDVIGYVAINGKEVPIAIEILVTHKVDQEKLQKIKAKRLRTIEIDLSEYKENDLPRDKLADIILDNSPEKKWIYNPKMEKYDNAELKCERKRVHWARDIHGNLIEEYVVGCPRNKFSNKGNYEEYCLNCPHMIPMPRSHPHYLQWFWCERPQIKPNS